MLTEYVVQDVIDNTPPSPVSFLKITKSQCHPAAASLKLYSVQVALHDLAVTTQSGLHSQPSSPPCTEHIPKISILIPDPVLARAFPALIQQFKGDDLYSDADEVPDPVRTSHIHSYITLSHFIPVDPFSPLQLQTTQKKGGHQPDRR